MSHTYNPERYKNLARQAVAEGCVLLKNDNEALPLRKGEKVAIFGRCAQNYYKSGLGSGGLVNTDYVVSILDALKNSSEIILHDGVLKEYEKWSIDHPIDEGNGWGTVPWFQEEMELSDVLLEQAKDADTAIAIIGRTAGEDQDNSATEGSYLLTQKERAMIETVCKNYNRSIVLLNVGNIIDMSWVEEYKPAAVMYVWQGGQEGGNGIADVMLGHCSPSGKLTDTIAKHIRDYPSDAHFGGEAENIYTEDIYVGYRYFETFHSEQVLYPFGYGLSYTDFSVTAGNLKLEEDSFSVTAHVKNTGKAKGKEVVQIYVGAPRGRLDKPEKVLAGFAKTKELEPGEEVNLQITCQFRAFASFDDSGCTGHSFSWVLEAGKYLIYAGKNVRDAKVEAAFTMKERVLEQLQEACAPVKAYNRFHLENRVDGTAILGSEPVPLQSAHHHAGAQFSVIEKVADEKSEQNIPYGGDKGYQLADVAAKKVTMEQFLSQLRDEDMVTMFRGEGMCSPKVTPGTASAFGGVSEELKHFGIPIACCADGPSGIRMDCGTVAFSLPNGTMIGSTFNLKLAEELYQMLGAELSKNRIDSILGPGINIHRHPLNGRNFEYFSEDPLLTGLMCVAQLQGLHKEGVTGTIKHFCANNQEYKRTEVDSIVSMRALREIYLVAFELAVKVGHAKSIMTSYNPINGIWAAGNNDLCTRILREDWGYTGIVMTDWWAAANWEGETGVRENRAPMIMAQNDLYMCCTDAVEENEKDNVSECLKKGIVTREHLLRNTRNILNFLMWSAAMNRKPLEPTEQQMAEGTNGRNSTAGLPYFSVRDEDSQIRLNQEVMDLTVNDILFGLALNPDIEYTIEIVADSDLTELAQLPVSFYMDNIFRSMISFRGSNGDTVKKETPLRGDFGANHYIKLKKQGRGLNIREIIIRRK